MTATTATAARRDDKHQRLGMLEKKLLCQVDAGQWGPRARDAEIPDWQTRLRPFAHG